MYEWQRAHMEFVGRFAVLPFTIVGFSHNLLTKKVLGGGLLSMQNKFCNLENLMHVVIKCL